ncbi:S-adenosyl-L-methionine-dependent methyltransferase [Scenedesmus sp. NREL 46B-D3]|nr:S-adenosyl-L-methionine-dependent methyltransferase [Scenedesmus sp. NREL 46B-D3]
MPGRPWKAVCTFSGVGGFALGLRGLVEPSLFCDIDAYATAVLRERFPKTPVHGDVHTLSADALRTQYKIEPASIDLLLASFPCQSHSLANRNRKQMNDERGGLFFEAIRLLKDIRPKLAFFENVRGILGSKDAWSAAILEAGYTIRYCVIPAYAVGARHERMRWFCLCVRDGPSPEPLLDLDHKKATFNFNAKAPPRTANLDASAIKANKARITALGNAIVPSQARLAFCYLVSGGRIHDFAGDALHLMEPLKADHGIIARRRDLPEDGNFVHIDAQGKEWPMPLMRFTRPRLGLVFDPRVAEDVHASDNKDMAAKCAMKADLWATPVACQYHATNILTARSGHVLPTQVKYELSTEGRSNPLSADFVEWLMGFPKGWTRVSKATKNEQPKVSMTTTAATATATAAAAAATAAAAAALLPSSTASFGGMVLVPMMLQPQGGLAPMMPQQQQAAAAEETKSSRPKAKGTALPSPKSKAQALAQLKDKGWTIGETTRPGTKHIDRVFKSPKGRHTLRSLKTALEQANK